MFDFFRKKQAPRATEATGSLDDVIAHLKNMGYDLLPHGTAVALLELKSGYNAVETASHIAHVTLARDIRDAGQNTMKLVAFVPHAQALIEVLTRYKNNGKMHPTQWQNDCRAILGIVMVDANQLQWLEKVLSDPVSGAERLAKSRIEYKVPEIMDDDDAEESRPAT